MTIGIGAVCHNGAYILLASDKRASYGNKKKDTKAIDPNDNAGKQFDFHPLKMAASIAGSLGVTHDIIGELTLQFAKLIRRQEENKPVYREHIENAIDRSRSRQMRRPLDGRHKGFRSALQSHECSQSYPARCAGILRPA